MQRTSTLLRLLSIGSGIALVGCQIRLNLEAVGNDLFSGIALSAMVLPIAMVIAVAVLETRIALRQYGLALLAGVVLLAGVAHTLVVALERGVHAREQLAAERAAPNAARELLVTAHASALERVRDLEGAEVKPCRWTTRRGEPTRECSAARAQTAEARKVADQARDALASAVPAVDTNGMHDRYGVLADAIDLVHPVLLPMALELGGLVLVGFGFAGRKREPVIVQASPVVRPLRVVQPQLSVRAEAALTGRSKSSIHRERQKLRLTA